MSRHAEGIHANLCLVWKEKKERRKRLRIKKDFGVSSLIPRSEDRQPAHRCPGEREKVSAHWYRAEKRSGQTTGAPSKEVVSGHRYWRENEERQADG
jgi:hypothetical protein